MFAAPKPPRPVPPAEVESVPLRVIGPGVATAGAKPVLPAEKVVTPPPAPPVAEIRMLPVLPESVMPDPGDRLVTPALSITKFVPLNDDVIALPLVMVEDP